MRVSAFRQAGVGLSTFELPAGRSVRHHPASCTSASTSPQAGRHGTMPGFWPRYDSRWALHWSAVATRIAASVGISEGGFERRF